MKRRLITHRGKRVRKRASGARGALFALCAAVGAGALLAGSGALAGLSKAVDADFFDAALEREFSPSPARSSLLELAIGPTLSLSARGGEPSAEPSPAAAPLRTEPSAKPAAGTSEQPPSAEPSAEPSYEPNAADLDPNIRTVTIAPSSTDGYDCADGVFIKNGTDFEIDVASYLEGELRFERAPHILIVHTHACEAYYPEGDDLYEPTDTERTEDKNFNVVRVGDELATILSERGYSVEHIREIFDYPSYNGSYSRALEAIEQALADDGEISIVLDVHRDAIEGADGSTWRAVCDTDEGLAAQSMLVVGTDEGGLSHPNWRQNLLFAVHLQKYIADRYPTLMRPITLSPSRYNQHATSGSLILEVGASGNTLSEALLSARLVGGALCDFLDEVCG